MRGIQRLIEPPQLGIERKPGLRFVRLPFPHYPATELFVPFDDVNDVSEILRGRYDFERFKGEPNPRTVLDLAPGCGAFAAWFYSRFPYAWVDMIQPDEDMAKTCAINGPPGSTCRTIAPCDFFGEIRDLIAAKRTELAAAMGDINVKLPGVAVDAVHFGAESAGVLEDMKAMPIDWAGVKLVVVEVAHGTRFAGAAHAFASMRFEPLAAGAKFQVWGRKST